MKLKIERKVENNKFITVVGFEEWGSVDITSEDEKGLLENFPCILNYKDITFNGKFDVKSNEVVIESTAGETVTLSLIDKITPLTEAFQVKYEVSSSQILDTELGAKLTTKELVCQAKIILFENKVQEKMKDLLTGAKAKNNNFEKSSPTYITI